MTVSVTCCLQSKHACFHCGTIRAAMKACKRCHQSRYCSPACQAAAWPAHKGRCKIVRDAQKVKSGLRHCCRPPTVHDIAARCNPYDHVFLLPEALQVRQAIKFVSLRRASLHQRLCTSSFVSAHHLGIGTFALKATWSKTHTDL